MSHKIIFPEGIELIEYLNRGYAICNECGALMERREEVTTFRLPDAVRAVDRIRIANCHASYLTTNKAEEKS